MFNLQMYSKKFQTPAFYWDILETQTVLFLHEWGTCDHYKWGPSAQGKQCRNNNSRRESSVCRNVSPLLLILAVSEVQFTLSPLEGRRSKIALSKRYHIKNITKWMDFFVFVYLLWAGKSRWGWGLHPANCVRGQALWFIAVVLLGGGTVGAAVLFKCIRILLLRKLVMIYCIEITMISVYSFVIRCLRRVQEEY